METILSTYKNMQATNASSDTEFNRCSINFSFHLPMLSRAQTYNLIPSGFASGLTAGTNWNRTGTGTNSSGCEGRTFALGPAGGTGTGTYTLNITGGTQVNYIAVALDGMDFTSSLADEVEISVNGSILTLNANNFSCVGANCSNNALFSTTCLAQSTVGLTVTGTNRIKNVGIQASGGIAGKGVYIVSSPTPITSISITNYTNASSGGTGLGLYLLSNVTGCTFEPQLSSYNVTNACPVTTVDLTTITATNMPAGATLTWHTGTPATTANKIAGTGVAAGTYYAAFFDATNNCYSGSVTTAVTASVSNCCTVVSPISN